MNKYTILVLIAISLGHGNLFAQGKTKKTEIQFGKAFLLSSKESSKLENSNESIEITIIDIVEEWGYDAPPEDENRNYFSDVQYTLKIQANNDMKEFSFYSSEVENNDNFNIHLKCYSIFIVSDNYTSSTASIKMILNKNECN